MKPGTHFKTTQQFITRNWFQFTVLALLLYMFFKKDLAFQIQVQTPEKTEQTALPKQKEKITENTFAAEPAGGDAKLEMPFISGTAPERNAMSELAALDELTRQAYLERFAKVAVHEQEKFGIPASITLSMALYQSVAGRRDLALKGHNNHFALPCTKNWDGPCQSSQGLKYRQYETAWASFRDFSRFASGNFPTLKGKGYKAWAHALEKTRFGEDNQLSDNLIRIIEGYRLYALDE
ncbi:MAG: glucosaminidase domain-containing protein [Saprospiraceae bacterium]